MSIDEQRVRLLAYQIWESEGCPMGQDQRHWQQAIKLAEAEALAEAQAQTEIQAQAIEAETQELAQQAPAKPKTTRTIKPRTASASGTTKSTAKGTASESTGTIRRRAPRAKPQPKD